MLVSTFEVLVKPQLPSIPGITDKLSRKVIQGYFLTIANVNLSPVTVSVVFTLNFPKEEMGGTRLPRNFKDFLDAVDISGKNLFTGTDIEATLVPEMGAKRTKARLTFTLPANDTGLLILQPDILIASTLSDANFEARGYVEIFLSSLSDLDKATLIVTPEQRGTFFKNLGGTTLAEVGLDQIAYCLPVSNGGVFKLSNKSAEQ